MIGPSRSDGAGRDALPRVRRGTSRRFFLLLLRTRSCAFGAEVFSRQLLLFFYICTLSGGATPDRAGARPYQPQRHRLLNLNSEVWILVLVLVVVLVLVLDQSV